MPLLHCQGMISCVNGSKPPPPMEVSGTDGKTEPNSEYLTWYSNDQRIVLLLQSSLTEEAMSVVLGCTTSAAFWTTLEAAFGNTSESRAMNLRMALSKLQKGSRTVSEFGRDFKHHCDQLAAMGRSIPETEKSHWFLQGLGIEFSGFSAAAMHTTPLPTFQTLLPQAESFKTFMQSIAAATPPPTTSFVTQTHPRSSQSFPHNSRGGGRGCGRGKRPYCQICRTNGHYADRCEQRYNRPPPTSKNMAHLAEAFSAACSINGDQSDWFMDSGASAHMTSSSSNLDSAKPYFGYENVQVGNGNLIPISHIGATQVNSNIQLLDVLVVPQITKNLLSVRKLTFDFPVDILFSDEFFDIQNRQSGDVVARGTHKNGLYVLEQGHSTFLAALRSKRLKASYELWHSRLGHVATDVISLLNKLGQVSVTSILPKPFVCSLCHLAKSKRLPFSVNEKRSSSVLDLIHCNLWGPAPVVSANGFRYYAIFVDDFSRFVWFYPLQLKSDFYKVLLHFSTFVKTQFERQIKVFQSDGGTEFTNNKVKTFFSDNDILHQLSCPHTPTQNGRAVRKHRHITETAFTTAVYTINRLPSSVLDNKSPFEVLFHTTPNYENFRPFGCRVYPYLRDYCTTKLAPRSVPCIFIGNNNQYKGYRCLDPVANKIFTTRHAQFDEAYFSYHGEQSHNSKLPGPTMEKKVVSNHPLPAQTESSSVIEASTPCSLCFGPPSHEYVTPTTPNQNLSEQSSSPSQSSSTPPSLTDQHLHGSHLTESQGPSPSGLSSATPNTTSVSQSTHQMQTRSKSHFFKPRHFADLAHVTESSLLTVLYAANDPKGYKSASKNPKWVMAMDDEIAALRRNDTWDLVPQPTYHNVVGSKWVFRTKFHADGVGNRRLKTYATDNKKSDPQTRTQP
ncbi:LOW QUALITY PROTEIN: hypothetical protein OSB04_029365 [Centaurea solstitialis]|uniref:Integrase catalytic domain-containing protein n=1 Tax=Centaurea solstitialis TaxID=347529 RepID=A0AA38SJ44_9ASTR|nr:LOW QUALITY PROTEIN: hypothetical protein OSB04_029365 [Centaurea solstitialis]